MNVFNSLTLELSFSDITKAVEFVFDGLGLAVDFIVSQPLLIGFLAVFITVALLKVIFTLFV